MIRRRLIPVAAALGTLVAPLAGFAQGPTGSVTTGPVHQAPALGMPLIFLLAVALAGVTMYRLRRAGAGPIVGLVLVAAVTVLAGLGYAFINTITISGSDCFTQTTNAFDPLGPITDLISNCPNPIRILDIEIVCDMEEMLSNPQTKAALVSSCQVGQTLANGDECTLPLCVT